MKNFKEIDKLAVEYISNGLSITKTARLLQVDRGTLASRLRSSGFSLPPSGGRKYSINHDFFETIDSEEKAYWLGFFFADGSMAKAGNHNRYVMELTLAEKDVEHIKKFNKAMSSTYLVAPREINLRGEVFKSFRTIFYSKKMYTDLLNYGIRPGKTYESLSMPDMEDCLKRHFLRGFFDGDGCIHNSSSLGRASKLSISSYDRETLDMVKEEIEKVIGETRLKVYKGKTSWVLAVSNRQDLSKILNYLYSDSSIYLKRKHDRYMKFCRLSSVPETCR